MIYCTAAHVSDVALRPPIPLDLIEVLSAT